MTIFRLNGASLTCLLLAVLGLFLGIWQWQRSLYKQDIALKNQALSQVSSQPVLGRDIPWDSTSPASDWDQRRVRLAGHWLSSHQIYLDNRALQGRAGIHVLTPLVLSDQSIVWVNRGWAPKAPGLGEDPMKLKAGEFHRPGAVLAELQAIGQASPMRRIELTRDPNILRQGAVWQNFDSDAALQWLEDANRSHRLDLQSPLRVWPVIFWQTSPGAEGLIQAIPIVSKDDVAKHRGYALQWWLLMLVALFFSRHFLLKADPQ